MALPPNVPGSRPSSDGVHDQRARDEERRTDKRRQELVADRCGELEEAVEQLRTRYELYFVGVERREPHREREEMRRNIARLKSETGLNTGLRFRIDTLHARFVSYERMWLRTAREKEEGTYRRDLQRLRRKRQEERSPGAPPPKPVAEAASPQPPPVATPKAEPVPARAKPPAGAPPDPRPRLEGAGGLSREQLQALYVAYVDAKKRCNEDVSRITYEALAKTVARQVPEILARYKANSVEFRVLIKDGRALLKAVPRT